MLRLVVITGLVVAAGLGCDDSEDPVVDGAPASVTTTSGVTTSTTVSFEDEVKQAAIDLLAIRNEVFQSPDVSRVPEYIAETCVCLERERGFIERFESEGLRWTAPPIVPLGVRVTSADEVAPTLTVVAEQPASAVISSTGSTVESAAALPRAVYLLSLVESSRGWMINGLDTFAELSPEIAESIVAEGLP